MSDPRRTVLEIGPSRAAKGGVAAMAALSERLLAERGWDVVPIETTSAAARRATTAESLWAVRDAWNAIARYPDAIVHIHASQGGSLARKGLIARVAHERGNPVLFHVHGSHFDAWARENTVRRWWARRVLGCWSDAVVALSPSWQRRLESLAPGARIVVVPNAIEPLVSSAHVGDCDPLVVFAGRLENRKGIDVLLDALSRLQGAGVAFRVLLAGDGDVEGTRAAVESLPRPDRVDVPGWLENGALRERVTNAAIFVLPSRDEGLPLVLLEAMSAGLACVVSSVGAMPEAIEDGVNGVLVAPGDAEALTGALGGLLRDSDERARLGVQARTTALERYSADVYGRRLDEVLSSLQRSA